MAVYTDQEIQEALDAFFETVAKRQYIGARYVPILGRKDETSIQWDNSAPYEPLTIVLYRGNSYTSRQMVPAGIDITNELYWACTGNYNAQIELYRQDVQKALEIATDAADHADKIESDYFNDHSRIEFESEYIDTLNGGYYVMKVPRDSYNIEIESATGEYRQGYAFDLLNKDPDILALSNCALDGLLLIDSNPLHENPNSAYLNSNRILAFKEDGDCDLIDDPDVTATSLKEAGYISAFQCGKPYIIDGIAQDITDDVSDYEVYEPHCFFGYNNDKWYIFQSIARCVPSLGLNRGQIQNILLDKYPELNWIDFRSGSDTQLYLGFLKHDIYPWVPNSTGGIFYAKPRRGFMCFKAKEED